MSSNVENNDSFSDCSESSRNSCISSNISTLSDLSEYQNEFLALKGLTSTGSKVNVTANIISWYEKEIEKLKFQLQNSFKQNDKYKHDISRIQKEKDILYSDKIEKLLIQNKHLENNLLAANNQIQRLFSIQNKTDNNSENTLLVEKILHLENTNHELTKQICLISSKVNQCNFQKLEIDNAYSKLKLEHSELKLDLEAKISSINGLKKKISEQHVQLEQMSQDNVKLSHTFELISNELQCTRKSENWYKNELKQVQQEKSRVNETILENQKVIASQEDKIEQLKLEFDKLQCKCDQIRLVTLKEKEEMLKNFEFVKNEEKRHESKNCSNIGTDIQTVTNYYESIIKDLSNDVVKVKLDFEHQQISLVNISKEKSDIYEKYMFSQNLLIEREHIIEKLENTIKELKNKLSSTVSLQTKLDSELLHLKQTCSKLELELKFKNDEKQTFEQSVQTIQEHFTIFKNKYMYLKNELSEKNKELLQLQKAVQELSLDNNIKECECSKSLKEKTLEIEMLKEQISYFRFESEKNQNGNGDINKNIVLQKQMSCEGFQKNPTNLCSNVDKETHDNSQSETNYDSMQNNITSINEHSECTTNILNNIYKECKLSNDLKFSQYNVTGNDNPSKNDALLNQILAYLQFIHTEISTKNGNIMDLKQKANFLKKKILIRILKLVERCNVMELKNEENRKLLTSMCQKNSENNNPNEVQHLRTLLQVKVQEQKEMQKRYERHYTTLLRKVKEHMKGRKSVEKHNTYLQEQNSILSDNCNSLKLQLRLKESTLGDLQSSLNSYLESNEKLKSTLFEAEKELSATKPCKTCVEFEVLKKRINELLVSLKEYEGFKLTTEADLKHKEELLQSFQEQNQQLLQEISARNIEIREYSSVVEKCSQENKNLHAKLADIENTLTEAQEATENMKKKLIESENDMKIEREKEQLNRQLDATTDKNSDLIQEINYLNSSLQQRSEGFKELQNRKERSDARWLEKERNMHNLISNLKYQVHVFKTDIDIIKNEKFFLQRLCSDLKTALKTHITYSKDFKDYVEKLYDRKDKVDNICLNLSKFPSPLKCDDAYIDKLLEDTNTFRDKPSCDIQECINALRKEILFLQEEIAEKNVIN